MPNRSSEKTKHLGRGLESLLGPVSSVISNQNKGAAVFEEIKVNKNGALIVSELPFDLISPNPYQARTYWDDDKLQELSESIAANGVVQPIVVRRVGTGYQIIAGERRYRASQMAGKDRIPAIVREATEDQMHEWALVENIHRANLNPIERAKAYQAYIKAFSISQTEASQRLGEDRSVVANHLRLLELPSDLQQLLIDQKLAMGHARAILALPSDDLRRKLANRALAGRLSVREVERLVKQYLTQGDDKTPIQIQNKKPSYILELEDLIKVELGSKVKIETGKNGKSGKIVIEFKSLNDFDRVLSKIGVKTDNYF